MTPLEINRLCEWLIAYRDSGSKERWERDKLADICNALDGYAKLTRRVEALVDEHDIVDVGDGDRPGQGPNWAMQATTFLRESA